MGDGLKRASLEALCSRGPWRGVDLAADRVVDVVEVSWELTSDELRAYFQSIQRGAEDPGTLNFVGGSRKLDRARQLLRRAGLIVFSREDRRWRATLDAGTFFMPGQPAYESPFKEKP